MGTEEETVRGCNYDYSTTWSSFNGRRKVHIWDFELLEAQPTQNLSVLVGKFDLLYSLP